MRLDVQKKSCEPSKLREKFDHFFRRASQATLKPQYFRSLSRLPLFSSRPLRPTRPQQVTHIIYGLLQEECTVQTHDHVQFSMNAKI